MSEETEALWLAAALIERHGVESLEGDAAAELRRLSAVEAQRDALLEALRDLVQLEADGRTEYESAIPHWDAARAAIKAVEENT